MYTLKPITERVSNMRKKYRETQPEICTARQMYDAIINNWDGYEDLRDYILNEALHYGNGIPECDEFAAFVSKYV